MIRLMNNCGKHAVEALRYLSKHERPIGGEQTFNAIDLLYTADFLERELTRLEITDQMVERAAKALEKKIKQSKYEWTDEQFEIWWNKDPYFVSAETSWGDAFGRGTRKNRALWEARIILETALVKA
ncbi:hypothetical protein B7L88_gp064 [Rhizobium phage RHEph10]|uniref:hypothetical protein n=1 Tax=Rhizobium phage RHEph10 TaxID=1220717 RepID=UPI0002AB4F2C|nr:hypothetical protein B7L88_gp064 [Rhizobium phage RHEph10]AGC36108.1 hypothetical protein RHEph10_gp064 [Rhizobium phage RHEph10]